MRKRTLRTRVQKYFENNPVVVTIWIVVVFLSSLIHITEGFGLIKQQYYATIGRKYMLQNAVENMYPNQQISSIVAMIGEPSIVKEMEGFKGAKKEYIFINDYFYLQAITDIAENILSLAVTTRREDFNPTFIIPSEGNSIQLGKSKIYDHAPRIISGCFVNIGAHRFSYFEGGYLANPGNYQSYFVGYNESGFSVDFYSSKGYDSMYETYFNGDLDNHDCGGVPDQFRKDLVVNTYVITAPFATGTDMKDSEIERAFGPDYNDVRVIGK